MPAEGTVLSVPSGTLKRPSPPVTHQADAPMPLSVVILAAGQGKRMKSDLPKVLQPLAGRPLLGHVLDTAAGLEAAATCVVYGHGGEQVLKSFEGRDVRWALQAEQHGTGHAVMQAMPHDSRRPPGAGAVRRRAAGAARHARAPRGGGGRGRGEPAVGDAARSDRLRPHRPRRRRQRGAHRRAQGRERQGARDPRVEHRAHVRAGRPPEGLARGAQERQCAGRVLPHRHHRHGGAQRAARCTPWWRRP